MIRLCILASVLLFSTSLLKEDAETSPLERAAIDLLDSMDNDQKTALCTSFDDEERRKWHFVPGTRSGVSLGDMSTRQKELTHRLLQVSLSSSGYLKATAIILLEEVLREIEQRDSRDPGRYWIQLFGLPARGEPWGFRFEGHHLSLNYSSIGGRVVATTPTFLGTNPARVPHGPHAGLRVLAKEEDLAHVLVKGLSEDQRKAARIGERAPADIIMTPGVEEIGSPQGLAYDAMDEPQRHRLIRLIHEYTGNLEESLAEEHLARIAKGGLDTIHFSWAGSLSPGKGFYYRIHGATFVIEFDNVQNGANHVHTVFRDLENDFGRDLLREHYEAAHR